MPNQFVVCLMKSQFLQCPNAFFCFRNGLSRNFVAIEQIISLR